MMAPLVRRWPIVAWSIFALAAALCACVPAARPGKAPVNTAKIVDTIQTTEAHANQDWAARDTDKIVGFFAPNAVIIQPGAPPITGAAAIRAGVAQLLADPAFSLTFASDQVDVAASGDLAAARGTFRQTETDPKTKAVTVSTGSYVTVFKPGSDGVWRGVWDIVSPGPAAAGPAAPAKPAP